MPYQICMSRISGLVQLSGIRFALPFLEYSPCCNGQVDFIIYVARDSLFGQYGPREHSNKCESRSGGHSTGSNYRPLGSERGRTAFVEAQGRFCP